jgi:CheY-specific phosphatase CheX
MKSPLKCALIDAFGGTISGRIVYWMAERERRAVSHMIRIGSDAHSRDKVGYGVVQRFLNIIKKYNILPA